jgi:putative phosphoribosyl transferase
MFEDRKDAGKALANALAHYQNRGVLVLAIPRGGVEVGYQVAKALQAEFSILISRKLPFPDNPEAGFGAVTEEGITVILKNAARWLQESTVKHVIEEQKYELERRIQVLRGGESLPSVYGRTVILVDDGIAMGSTMQVSIQLCKERGAGRIVVAVPVAGQSIAVRIADQVDELIVLESPPLFHAVAQVYRNWHDVSDEDVLKIMAKWQREAQPQ